MWRMTVSPGGAGIVTVSGLQVGHVEGRSFEIDVPTTLKIEAEVSFEDDRPDADLAVLAWILDHSTGDVAWKTVSDAVTRRGVRAIVADSVDLAAGLYTAYLSAAGPDPASRWEGSRFGLSPHWTNYESFWHLDLTAPEGVLQVRDGDVLPTDSAPGSLFAAGLEDRETVQRMMFHVADSGVIRVKGGFTRCPEVCDSIIIQQIPDARVIWSVEDEKARPSGGSRMNQWLDTSIRLSDGAYEIILDPAEHNGSWSANPPWNPRDIGFSLTVEEGSIRTLDPWTGGQPLIDQTGLGDDASMLSRLVLEDSLDVFVQALGELTASGQRYDWGWIERENSADTIWEMTWENSEPAGGDADNRQSKAIFRLGPGTYLVGFQTDGSHSYERFNRSPPRNPERWGLALFPLRPERVTSTRVQVDVLSKPGAPPVPERPSVTGAAMDDEHEGGVLVNLTGLGNMADVRSRFVLDDTTRVLIMALGELSTFNRYDYGWIEDMASGEIVWEMTWENTVPAGGDTTYRRVREELVLPPGVFEARFQTDENISAEGYGSKVPDTPGDWGIAIFKAPR